MKVFRESEVTYNLGFVLDMSYIKDPLVANYIKNGGNKNFMEVVDLILERQKKEKLMEIFKIEGIDMETNDIYSFDSVKQYISGVIEIKQLLDQIKEKIAYRKEKKR